MKIRALIASLGTALALCVSSSTWAGYTVSLSASQASGVAGVDQTVIDVNLMVDSLENVDGIGFSLGYDPAVLQYHSGIGGSLLDPIDWFVDINDTGTDVKFSAFGFLGVDGRDSGTIAQITFDLMAAGSSALTLGDVTVAGITSPFGLTVTTTPAVININVTAPANRIPAPASLLLVGLGLALLGWTRRNAAAPNAG